MSAHKPASHQESGPKSMSSQQNGAIDVTDNGAIDGVGKSSKDGSLAPTGTDIVRDSLGRFVTGAAPRYVGPRGAAQYRKAILKQLPAEEVVEWIREAVELARSTRSARGLIAAAELAMSYGGGKPGAMKDEAGRVNLLELLQAAQGQDPDLGEPAIDGEAKPA